MALLFVAGLLIHIPGRAQDLLILTEENPPVSFTQDGELTGSSTAVVREILRRQNLPADIRVAPWARCYKLLTSENNVVLFTAARTPERENLFNWVGPLYTSKTGFYARKADGIRFASMAQIKKVGAIATYKDDVREQILTSLGFTNLDSSNSPVSNIKKLSAGRVDLWFYDNLGMPRIARQAGVDPESLKLVFTFKAFDGYIAMSRKMPVSIVKSWQETLDQMKQDGTFARLSLRWLPLENLPKAADLPSSNRQPQADLAIYTENNPPGNYLSGGKPTGVIVDLVREILRRLNRPDTITVVPWARGYNLARSQPNVALFSTTRLPQRENLFQWVGPVYAQRWGFYAKRSSDIRIDSLEGAKETPRIGTYRNDAKEQFLLKKGFTNLISANNNASNVKHLFQGNIDMWVSSDFNMPFIVEQAGFDPGQLETVLAFRTVENYIAFSLETPKDIVVAWQRVLDQMKQDGTYARIIAQNGSKK
jgi:polar amino acid transport system substrate-binding protein